MKFERGSYANTRVMFEGRLFDEAKSYRLRVSQYLVELEKAARILVRSECFPNTTNNCPKMSTSRLT